MTPSVYTCRKGHNSTNQFCSTYSLYIMVGGCLHQDRVLMHVDVPYQSDVWLNRKQLN